MKANSLSFFEKSRFARKETKRTKRLIPAKARLILYTPNREPATLITGIAEYCGIIPTQKPAVRISTNSSTRP